MEQTKTALTALEQAILKLESAIHASKKTQAQLADQVAELKQVLQSTYRQVDTLINQYQKDGE